MHNIECGQGSVANSGIAIHHGCRDFCSSTSAVRFIGFCCLPPQEPEQWIALLSLLSLP